VPRQKLNRSRPAAWAACGLGLGCALVFAGCVSAPPAPPPVSAEAQAAYTLIERRGAEWKDLRTLAEIRIRRDKRVQRLAGVLLLRAPSSLRFEALSPFGTPIIVVAGDEKTLTVWEVLDDKAYALPASPDANRRWLGLAMGIDELVALLSGRVLPLKDPLTGDLLPADPVGPSLSLRGADATQRIWFDPATGQAREVQWTGGANPARVVFAETDPDSPPAGVTLATLDGKLEVAIKYRKPRVNTGFSPDLLKLTIPEHVKIQEFR
jgi:outer membrane lipoprotein-sorting protein